LVDKDKQRRKISLVNILLVDEKEQGG